MKPTFSRWWKFWWTVGGPVTPPISQNSQKPIVFKLTAGDNYISGIGIPNSTINVTLPNSTILTTTVDSANNWVIPINPGLNPGDSIKTTQTQTR